MQLDTFHKVLVSREGQDGMMIVNDQPAVKGQAQVNMLVSTRLLFLT